MAKIFISYRREDSRWPAGSIQERLRTLLPRDEIYFDVDSIPAGQSFRDHLEAAVSECDYVIAIIGKTWANICDDSGRRRLDNPNDWVRIELETALDRGIPVIPVLLDTMTMPEPSLLPDKLKRFSERQAVCIRPHPDFDNDIQKISRAIQKQESQRQAARKSQSRLAKLTAKAKSPRKPVLYVGVAVAVPIALVLMNWMSNRNPVKPVGFTDASQRADDRVVPPSVAVEHAVGAPPATFTVKPGETITNSIGMKLALIPAGEFLMGSEETKADLERDFKLYDGFSNDDEHPKHRVRMTRPYYLGTYEVTRGQFGRFVETASYETEAEKDGKGGFGWDEAEKGHEQDPEYSWRNPGFEQTDDHPVVNVSWNDAVAFCEWLNKKEGKQYRLPTEAQWEYACRGGTTTRFSSGDDPESLALVGNTADGTLKAKYSAATTISARDGHVFTAPVGEFRANGFGLYDMHGNAREWCSDWYDEKYYAASPLENPEGPSSGSLRVSRGGAWSFTAVNCRSAYRSRSDPSYRDYYLGFRVCLVP